MLQRPTLNIWWKNCVWTGNWFLLCQVSSHLHFTCISHIIRRTEYKPYLLEAVGPHQEQKRKKKKIYNSVLQTFEGQIFVPDILTLVPGRS